MHPVMRVPAALSLSRPAAPEVRRQDRVKHLMRMRPAWVLPSRANPHKMAVSYQAAEIQLLEQQVDQREFQKLREQADQAVIREILVAILITKAGDRITSRLRLPIRRHLLIQRLLLHQTLSLIQLHSLLLLQLLMPTML